MVMIVIALVAFLAILALGYPLVNPEQYRFETANGDERLESLLSQRNNVFDAIKDLDFDHATGKLSDEDYRQMRARYDLQAAEVLQKMDTIGAGKTRPRAKNGTAGAGRAACAKCGAKVQAADRFCPVCGSKLT
ncbi:MAG: zinc-ribbon domain-containing protein [Rudaea sp.]